MAKKKLRKVIVSISKLAIYEAMAKMGYSLYLTGGGTVEFEGETFLSDEGLISAITQKLAEEFAIATDDNV